MFSTNVEPGIFFINEYEINTDKYLKLCINHSAPKLHEKDESMLLIYSR